jgi:hypothetical protein
MRVTTPDGTTQDISARESAVATVTLTDGSVYEFRPTVHDEPFSTVTVSIFRAATSTEPIASVGELQATKGGPTVDAKSKPNFKVAILKIEGAQAKSPRRPGDRRTTTMCKAIALLLSTSLVAVAGDARERSSVQQPAATFKADVNLVEVHAVVTDSRGEFVRDLTRDDFEIYESGRLQTPSVFQLVDLPSAVLARDTTELPRVEPDVRMTSPRFEGRLYVLVLDDLHTSALRSQLVKRAARQFIERHLADGDLAAVILTSGRTDAAQELTPSHRLLLAAVDKFQGQKLPSITSERLAVHLIDRHHSP